MFGARLFMASSLVAVATITAGLLGSAAPVYAIPEVPLAPGNCADFEFPGNVQFNLSSGDRLTFFANGKDSSGPAMWSNNKDFPGTFTGSIGFRLFLVDFTDNTGTQQFQGEIAPNGIATGTVIGLPGVTWQSTTPFTCIEQDAAAAAPAQGPAVVFNPILGGMQVTVTDRSGVASQCTYAADNGFTRSFALGAKATSTLNIVPAVPELRDWSVSVSCDNGTRTDTTTFF